ncbi:hypothetical protein ACGCUQ_07950 [Eubacteriales bacterium KG127]
MNNTNKNKNNRRENLGRKTAILLSLLLIGSLVMPIYGEEIQENTPKEEVVYGNLTTQGAVKSVSVVNIFDLDKETQILDYGEYERVKPMNSKAKVRNKAGMVTTKAGKGRLYYEGVLKDKPLPWNVDIKYSLDGKELPGKELAGRSGALTISVNVSENQEVSGKFFNKYPMQINVLLDTYKAKNIKAENMTIANVGSKKQLTYTALPGKGADFTIKADVEDFEMDGISINALPIRLNIDLDDKDLLGKLDELKTATGSISTGASQLDDGVSAFKSQGTDKLSTGVMEMEKTLAILDSHSGELGKGSKEFRKAISQVNEQLQAFKASEEDLNKLRVGSSQVASGIDQLVMGIGLLEEGVNYQSYKSALAAEDLDLDQLTDGNTRVMEKLDLIISTLEAFSTELENRGIDTAILKDIQDKITQLRQLAYGNNASIQGTEIYLTRVNEEINKILAGGKTLQSSYAVFDEKINELVDGLSFMTIKLNMLAQAINQLVIEYEKLDNGIEEYTGGVSQITLSYGELTSGVYDLGQSVNKLKDGTSKLRAGTGKLDSESKKMKVEAEEKLGQILGSLRGGTSGSSGENSFVSERNTQVNSVQFVVKTDSIRVADKKVKGENKKPKKGFFQKLKELF